MKRLVIFALFTFTAQPALAATLRVPQDHKTIQAAIDASQSGDKITVAPGNYIESILLKPGIILRSDGEDSNGTNVLLLNHSQGQRQRRPWCPNQP